MLLRLPPRTENIEIAEAVAAKIRDYDKVFARLREMRETPQPGGQMDQMQGPFGRPDNIHETFHIRTFSRKPIFLQPHYLLFKYESENERFRTRRGIPHSQNVVR